MTQHADAPPPQNFPLTADHIKAARWSAQHAAREGFALIQMETHQVLQLLDAAERGLALKQEDPR